MGTLLDKVYEIWQDPEKAYTKFGKSKTRKEFFLEMCNVSLGKHKLDFLKASIMKEYEDDPEKASGLADVFDLVSKNWSTVINVDEIADITKFLTSLANQDTFVGPEEITKNLFPYRFKEQLSVSIEFIAERFGRLGDVVALGTNNVPIYFKAGELNDDRNIFMYTSARVKRLLESVNQKGKFLDKVWKLIESPEQRVKYGSIFIDTGKFEKSGGYCKVIAGSATLMYPVVETKTVNRTKFILCQSVDNNMKTDVYCML